MGGELRELIEGATIERLFLALAILVPLLGAGVGAWLGAKRQEVRGGALRGFGFGLFATLNWVLWRIYSVLTSRLGLDSVANVLVNLALFTAVGLALGVWLGRRTRRPEGEP